jgi:ATP-dependent helicase YprA (DUF1998 family)
MCKEIFAIGGKPLDLYSHQSRAIALAHQKKNYVVTTGTGSGKSLTFIIPIISSILKDRDNESSDLRDKRTKAIIIYPMNALANSQQEEFNKYLSNVEDLGISVRRYTGQEKEGERKEIAKNPPDVLLTNYMMLEYLLTRSKEDTDRKVIEHCEDLKFIVLDELHTYRGRQGADVALLMRRLRITTHSDNMVCIGTSATMSSDPDPIKRRGAVSNVASTLFGAPFSSDDVIEESLIRTTDDSVQDEALNSLLTNYLEGITPPPEFQSSTHQMNSVQTH